MAFRYSVFVYFNVESVDLIFKKSLFLKVENV